MRTDVDWTAMEAEYLAGHRGKGGVSLAHLASRNGVSLATVERRAAVGRWYQRRLELARTLEPLRGWRRVFAEAIAGLRSEGKA